MNVMTEGLRLWLNSLCKYQQLSKEISMTSQNFKLNKKNDLRIKIIVQYWLEIKNRPSSPPGEGGDGPVVSGGYRFTLVEE
jgi:hypothetical protein